MVLVSYCEVFVNKDWFVNKNIKNIMIRCKTDKRYFRQDLDENSELAQLRMMGFQSRSSPGNFSVISL